MTQYLYFDEHNRSQEIHASGPLALSKGVTNALQELVTKTQHVRGTALESFLNEQNLTGIRLDYLEGTIGHFLLTNHFDILRKLISKLDPDTLTRKVLNIPLEYQSDNDLYELGKDIKLVLLGKPSRFGIVCESVQYRLQEFIRICIRDPKQMTQEKLDAVLQGSLRELKRPVFIEYNDTELLGNPSKSVSDIISDNPASSAWYFCENSAHEAIATLEYAIKHHYHLRKRKGRL